ncbi:MAG: TauD/TfdA family dioxygenase [Pseudomonadales bacterium]
MGAITMPDGWQIKKLAPALGAEIRGLRLSGATPDDIEAIKDLLHQHLVLFFPDQHPDVEEHVAFGRQFGQLEGHPNLKNPYTEHPELFELAATNGGVADEWHTDITFRPEPALMSILHMVKCPEIGGDTMWSSLYAAYDNLSPPMQDLCEGLTALHDALPHNKPDQMAVHPVVRVHPVTGRKALYVNEHFTRRIVELNAGESDTLLRYLTRWVTSPAFVIRYRWTEGTVAIWDNRCTQHFVLNDFQGERIIQRVTIMGDKPEGAREPRWRPWIRPGRLSATSRHDRQLHQYLKSLQDAGKVE